MSDEISRVLNNLAVDEQQLRTAYDMPFLAHRQKEAREIIVAIQARNERLEKVLANLVNRYTMNDYTYTGSDSRSDAIKEAKAVLEEGKK
jgi:hypothetical protein